MVSAALPVAAPKSRLVRYWSDAREPHTDGHIRIEWVGKDGQTRTSAGRYYIDDNCVVWDYEEPPNRVYNDAIECAGSAGDFTVVSIDRAVIEFAGRETYAQMCAVVEAFSCSNCSRPVDGYTPTVRDAKLAAADGLCEECHQLNVKAAKRERSLAAKELI